MIRLGLMALLLFAPPEPPLGETGETGELGETGETGELGELGETGAEDLQGPGVTIDPTPAPAPPQAEPPRPATPKAPANDPDAPITVTTRLTPDPAHVGDVLKLEVIVAYPADHAINLPNGLDFAPLELRSIEPGAVESSGKGLRQRFTIELQYFELGQVSVPSFPVTWIGPDEAVHTYHVAPHPFVVESLHADESEPERKGEDPPVSLEYPNRRLANILYGLMVGWLVALIFAVVWFALRRRGKPVYVPPPIPAHERAFAELETLAGEREALIEAGAYQDYYLRLTEIAKRYLGGRFGFEALDRTTEEIEALFASPDAPTLEPLDPGQVLLFLQDCDLIKFARLSPPPAEARAAFDTVYDMVDRSQPRPDPETPETPEPRDPARPIAHRPQPPQHDVPQPLQAPATEPTPPEPRQEEPPTGGQFEPPKSLRMPVGELGAPEGSDGFLTAGSKTPPGGPNQPLTAESTAPQGDPNQPDDPGKGADQS